MNIPGYYFDPVKNRYFKGSKRPSEDETFQIQNHHKPSPAKISPTASHVSSIGSTRRSLDILRRAEHRRDFLVGRLCLEDNSSVSRFVQQYSIYAPLDFRNNSMIGISSMGRVIANGNVSESIQVSHDFAAFVGDQHITLSTDQNVIHVLDKTAPRLPIVASLQPSFRPVSITHSTDRVAYTNIAQIEEQTWYGQKIKWSKMKCLSLAYTRGDHGFLIAGGDGNNIFLFDRRSPNNQQHTRPSLFGLLNSPVHKILPLKDERYVVTLGYNGAANMLDLAFPKQPLFTYQGHRNSHHDVGADISENSNLLAVGSATGTVRLWSLFSADSNIRYTRELNCSNARGLLKFVQFADEYKVVAGGRGLPATCFSLVSDQG